MESLEQIKMRIRGVKNVGKITKAMEVVSATKMRKSQEVLLKARPYAFFALQLLERLLPHASHAPKLMEKRDDKNVLLVIVASDKGLTGAFNAQVLRRAEKIIEDLKREDVHPTILAVGKKSELFALKKKINISEVFTKIGDVINPARLEELSNHIIKGFLNGTYGKVIVISTHFRTTLKQEVVMRNLLPVELVSVRRTARELIPEHGRYADATQEEKNGNGEIDYIFEPSPDALLDSVFRHLVWMELYHLILEANASEHSARRVAMKTARDNADELVENLTLEYNKARQADITNEIIEITSTEAAMSK